MKEKENEREEAILTMYMQCIFPFEMLSFNIPSLFKPNPI
jgi:hypothetical protein